MVGPSYLHVISQLLSGPFTNQDILNLFGNVVPVQISMVCSSCYHLFNCHGADTHDLWLRVDLFGITLAICGCYIPGVYYAFYCHEVR